MKTFINQTGNTKVGMLVSVRTYEVENDNISNP